MNAPQLVPIEALQEDRVARPQVAIGFQHGQGGAGNVLARLMVKRRVFHFRINTYLSARGPVKPLNQSNFFAKRMHPK